MFKTIVFLGFLLAAWIAPAEAGAGARMCRAIVEEAPPEAPDACSVRPTSRVELALNLDASTKVVAFPYHSWKSRRSSFMAFVRIYDSLGNPHFARLEWTKDSNEGEWTFQALLGVENTSPFSDLTGITLAPTRIETDISIEPSPIRVAPFGNPQSDVDDSRPENAGPRLLYVSQGFGNLQFDVNGSLVGNTEIPIAFAFGGDADPEQEIIFSFQSERGATTQFGSDFSVFSAEEDGFCPERFPISNACWLPPSLARQATESAGGILSFGFQGVMLSNAHERVQGRRFELATGELDEPVTDARIPAQLMPPAATQYVGLGFELDGNLAIVPDLDPTLLLYDPRMSINVAVYDSVGQPHILGIQIWRSSQESWEWAALRDLGLRFGGGFWNGSWPPTIYAIMENGRGRLIFDDAGQLTSVVQGDVELSPGESPRVIPHFGKAGDPEQVIEIDFGVGRTRLAEASVIFSIDKDGFGAGTVLGVRVSEDQVLFARASSGIEFPISELAFASREKAVCDFACSNRRDDDGDGLVDARRDPGCSSGLDRSERSRAFVCDDGLDNDRDGLRDYPEDPGCDSPYDDDESPAHIAIQIVDPPRGSRGSDKVLVIAVLRGGGVPLDALDVANVRLEPTGTPTFEPDPQLLQRFPEAPDADCDGREDRLLFFRVKGKDHGKRHREICISGTFDPALEEVDPALRPWADLFSHHNDYERFEFGACTTRRGPRKHDKHAERSTPGEVFSEKPKHAPHVAPRRHSSKHPRGRRVN